MKKLNKIIAIALIVLSVCALAACGGDKYANIKLNVSGIGANLVKLCRFEYTPDVIDDPSVAASTLKLDESMLNTVDGKPEIFYAVSAGYPEAVFVIGAKDAASAKSISEGPIKDWIKFNREGYESYGPDQVPKLDSAVNTVAGRYVILIVSNDNAAAKNTLTGLLDTALSIAE